MTREDIDNIISIICPNDEDFEKPIISPAYLEKELETLALEQEPRKDEVILTNKEYRELVSSEYENGYAKGYREALEQEPSSDMEEISEVLKCDADAETKCKMISNILNAKPHYFEKQEPSGDLISRQAVLNACEQSINILEAVDRIMDLPSVNQEPKTGHWIIRPHVYGVTYCSECDFELKIDDTNYCPNCGCRMVEPQESEE